MRKKVMSIIISAVMVVSISASIPQNVEEPSSSGIPGLPLPNISAPNPQNGGQLSSSSSGSGGLADSPWPMFRQNLNHTGLSPYDTSGNNGQLKWSYNTEGSIYSSPSIGSDGIVYIGSNDNKLHAINSDGTEVWRFTTDGSVHSTSLIDSNCVIYVGSGDNIIYAINSDGNEKWRFSTKSNVGSSPAIDSDGTIYIGSEDDKLYAINPDGTGKWNFTVMDSIISSPVIGNDGTIYFGSYDNNLYAIYPNGSAKWHFITGETVHSSPAIGTDGTIYVGSCDNRLYAINPNGTKKWHFTTGSAIHSSPAIGADDTIYVGCEDNNLYAIHPDGTEKWHFITGGDVYSSPAIAADGTIYVGSSDNNLYAIYPNGTKKWSYMTAHVIRSSPAIGSDGTIYVGSLDGKLYAIGNPNLDVNVTSHFSELNSAAQSAITVHVTDGTNPVQGATVNLDSDNGGIFSPQSGITDVNGDFKSIFNAPTVTTQIICRINANATKTGYNNGSGYVDVTINPIPWPMFRHNVLHTGLSPYDTSANPGKLKWSFMTGDRVISSPAIGSDGTIYVGSYDHKLYAINPDGTEQWNFITGSEVFSSPSIGADGTIYVGSFDNNLYAINADGSEKWNFMTGDMVYSSPTIGSDGTIYVGSHDGKLYAINPDGTQKWNFTTGQSVRSLPAIGFDGTIYISSYDFKLYAINPDGTEKWSFMTGDQLLSSPTVGSDGTIYVGSGDNKFYAVNPDGTEKWNFTTGFWVCSSPAIGLDETIYIGSYDDKMYAIYPDGSEKWNFTTGKNIHSSPSIGFDGTIYFGSDEGILYALNPDGSEKWNFTTKGIVFSSPAIDVDGTIYVGSYDNKLYAIGEGGTPPIADAGSDQTVNEGDVVQFNGTLSYASGVPPFDTDMRVDDSPSSAFNPQIRVDENGTIHVVWVDKRDWPKYGIYYTKSLDGGRTFLPAISVSDDSPGSKSSPTLDLDRNSGIHVAWTDSRNNNFDIYYANSFDGGKTFNKNIKVNDDELFALQECPDLAVDQDNVIHLAWRDARNNYMDIYYANSTDGGITFNSNFQVNDDDGAAFPSAITSIDVDSCGTPHIVWEDQRNTPSGGSRQDIYYATFTSTRDNFNTNIRVTDDNIKNVGQSHPSISVGPGDIIHIIWQDERDDKNLTDYNYVSNIYYSKSWDGGTSFTLNKRLVETGNVYSPSLAVDYEGDLHVVWQEGYLNSDVYYAMFNSNGDPLQEPIRVNYVLDGGQIRPDICLDSKNTPHIVWYDDRDKMFEHHVYYSKRVFTDQGDLKLEWDFDASNGLWWETGATPDATGLTPTHIYGDDGKFVVTLRVTDNDNLSATDTCNVTVQNVNPTVTIDSVTMEVEIGLRVAGRKYNNVSMALYEDGNPIGYVSIERMPGSPNEQMAWIPVSINFSKSYNATVTYIPEDPPNVGGNPVWIYLKSQNGSIKKIHHTFNVQQSKKRDSDHWNHVEPWEVDLNSHFIGLPIEITSHITDPGSDDETLTFTYGSQVLTITYLNNPPNPDPYPSPEVKPVDVIDTITLIYEGPGTVTLVVKDDDNIRLGVGQGSDSFGVG